MSKDYYSILGVEKNSSGEEIKKAFRKKAHQYHPDKKGGDEQRFKEVNEAYTVLSNDKKRAEYDAYGRVFSGAGAGAAGWDFSNFAQGFNTQGQGIEFDLGDIFEGFSDFFGGRARGTRRGNDISIDLEVDFKESVFGTERKVVLTKTSRCDKCGGTGAEEGSDVKTCPTCNGQGRVHETKQAFIGTFTAVITCKTCHGTGKVPEKKCNKCKGHGIVRGQEEIKISIPAGIDDGEVIRLSGAGEVVQGGMAGDLYVKVHVRKHPVFRKEGANVVMDLGVKLSDALLGAKYAVDTLDGRIEVKIPEGTSFGNTLRVKGKGIPVGKGRRGDLLIKLKVALPEKLSTKAKKLLKELRDEGI